MAKTNQWLQYIVADHIESSLLRFFLRNVAKKKCLNIQHFPFISHQVLVGRCSLQTLTRTLNTIKSVGHVLMHWSKFSSKTYFLCVPLSVFLVCTLETKSIRKCVKMLSKHNKKLCLVRASTNFLVNARQCPYKTKTLCNWQTYFICLL